MSDQKTAYITGATGFIGSHLADRLSREGYRVKALVRDTSDTTHLESLGAELVRGDITESPEKLRPGLEGATHVFHCAAYVDDWASREEMTRINVDGMRHLLEAVRGLPLERFLFMGSLVVYGLNDQVDLDESSPFEHTGDSYNETKIQCEELLQQAVRETGLPGVVLRPPYIYGPRDRQLFPRLCESIRSGEFAYISHGKIPFTLVYVENLVDACLLATTTPGIEGEAFIITDGQSVTRRELVEVLCEEMGYTKPSKSFIRQLARMSIPFFEGIAKLRRSSKPPRLNRFRYKFMAARLTFDISKAGRMLGYEPRVGTPEGLRASARWFREHHPEFLPDGKEQES